LQEFHKRHGDGHEHGDAEQEAEQAGHDAEAADAVFEGLSIIISFL
jgi:hypothetical protein